MKSRHRVIRTYDSAPPESHTRDHTRCLERACKISARSSESWRYTVSPTAAPQQIGRACKHQKLRRGTRGASITPEHPSKACGNIPPHRSLASAGGVGFVKPPVGDCFSGETGRTYAEAKEGVRAVGRQSCAESAAIPSGPPYRRPRLLRTRTRRDTP